jgi:hypothetical protein
VFDRVSGLFREESKFSINRCSLVGGMAKKTSTQIKADADIVVLYNDKGLDKDEILSDLQDILRMNTSLKEKQIRITKNSIMQFTMNEKPIEIKYPTLQFTMNGVQIDLILAENNAGTGLGKNVAEEQRTNSLLKFRQSGDYKNSAVVELGMQITESSVEFVKKQSKFVHDIARLGKYWNQGILFKEYVYGRSTIVENLAIKAAMDEENEKTDPSLAKAFERFLKNCCYIRSQEIVFEEYYETKDIPSEIRRQRPLLMDPVNQYNNLLDVKRSPNLAKLFDVFEIAAGNVLQMIGNGCQDINLIFCPQPMLYTLRSKEKWFLPTWETYLVGVSAYTNMELGLGGRPEGMIVPVMPGSIIRDPKGFIIRHDFDVFLHSLASYVYNRVYTNEKRSTQEVQDTDSAVSWKSNDTQTTWY